MSARKNKARIYAATSMKVVPSWFKHAFLAL